MPELIFREDLKNVGVQFHTGGATVEAACFVCGELIRVNLSVGDMDSEEEISGYCSNGDTFQLTARYDQSSPYPDDMEILGWVEEEKED
ncbi:hypothetical protein GTO10_06010 [Candidatus Saccharibacteria bacterium]|nr:hypothetical protein [Candidatus Saccharibacteria bacterium]